MKMKAAIYKQYGPPSVVHISEVDKPQHKNNQMLIKIHATCVNSGDSRMRSLNVPHGFEFLIRLFLGFKTPRKQILGMECAGIVEAIGSDVTNYRPGDKVFANELFNCHAEYKAIDEQGAVAHMPANLSFEQAAALSFGGVVALGFLVDKAKLKSGDKLLIIGATSTTGLASLQIAKNIGAHVTAVCSARNFDIVKKLGADQTIDYHKQKITHETLQRLAELAEQEKFIPTIDTIFELQDIVQAHEHVDNGHKVGSVVDKITGF